MNNSLDITRRRTCKTSILISQEANLMAKTHAICSHNLGLLGIDRGRQVQPLADGVGNRIMNVWAQLGAVTHSKP